MSYHINHIRDVSLREVFPDIISCITDPHGARSAIIPLGRFRLQLLYAGAKDCPADDHQGLLLQRLNL